ncbi:hypothetical protein CFP56_000674 [Quercus suber]|uniref:Uncharacterized protein n=1 Tax=Quercus suber TaxID=58331 RepID=A0AAW0LH87_QUESU
MEVCEVHKVTIRDSGKKETKYLGLCTLLLLGISRYFCLIIFHFGDLVQWCVECVGEWNVTTKSGGDDLRNASLRLKYFIGMGECKFSDACIIPESRPPDPEHREGMFSNNLGMRARILNCLGIQFPILFAVSMASAFPHNQQLIFKVHE